MYINVNINPEIENKYNDEIDKNEKKIKPLPLFVALSIA